MSAARPQPEMPPPAPSPRLLVDLPSRPRVFFSNLRDLLFPRRLSRLELHSAPAPFWHDVFVKRGLPWSGFLESVACHVMAFALLLGITRFLALRPQAVLKPTFDHAQVVVYAPSEYLPPLDTRSVESPQPAKADPELARQAIINVPRDADNHSQTIVTPPNVKLKHDVQLPNIVSWSDRAERPNLAIPVTPAAEITRIAPQMDAVVAPPPDPASARRDAPMLQTPVVAPPPEVRSARATPVFEAPQPAVVAPPPTVEAASRRVGDLNIGRSAVIAPAPQLAVGEQRALPGGRSSGVVGLAPRVVAPPPSVGAAGPSGGSGRMIALNLHPAVAAPDPPAGNRRGSFAATPDGHAGASGTAGSASGDRAGSGVRGTGGKGAHDLPAGLYVGTPGARPSTVAGDPSGKPSSPVVVASVAMPRATTAPTRTTPTDSGAKLSEAERAVFGSRKIYSLTLNMPNLNSAGGSWVIRFAELNHDSTKADPTATDLSQPTATRKVDPAYPMQLMRENVSGTVILYAIIHADGSVGNVRVLRGVDGRLDQLASQAVAHWQFEPATKNGSPVDVEATFLIPFRPARVGSNF